VSDIELRLLRSSRVGSPLILGALFSWYLELPLDREIVALMIPITVTGVTSLHSHSVLGRDSNKELSTIRAKGTSKGCEQSVVDWTVYVRGRSTSSDISSDISPSPLYIPPHRRRPKMECTRGSDTGVRWSRDVTFLSLFHHSPSFSSFHYFSSFYYFDSDFWYIDMHPTLAGLYPFLLGSPARCAFLSYFMFIYMFRIPC